MAQVKCVVVYMDDDPDLYAEEFDSREAAEAFMNGGKDTNGEECPWMADRKAYLVVCEGTEYGGGVSMLLEPRT
jgi:hypothetical protein